MKSYDVEWASSQGSGGWMTYSVNSRRRKALNVLFDQKREYPDLKFRVVEVTRKVIRK